MYIRCYYDLFKNMLILFFFCFFFKIDTDMKYTAPYRWNKPLKQNMDEHFNCSENLIVYKKKNKKNRQLTILLEIPNLSHTVNIKK